MNPQAAPLISTNSSERGSLLALSVELEGARACLLEEVNGQQRLAGWLALQNEASLEAPQQIINVCQRLGERLGRRLWHNAKQTPLWESDDPLRFPPLAQVSLSLMARPRLRVWLAGLSQSHSLAALKQILHSSPVRIVGVTLFTADSSSERLSVALAQARPDVLVIAGGYDDATPSVQRPLLALSGLVGQAIAELAPEARPALFFAGNRFAAAQAEALLRAGNGGVQLAVVGNVQPMPTLLRQRELANAINYYHWRLSERLPGFTPISRWVTSPGQVSSLTANFAQLVRVWMELHKLPQLHGLYCTADFWLHGWARQEQEGIRLFYAEPNTRPALLQNWPTPQLVIGAWPVKQWPVPSFYWWDGGSLAPGIAAIGQVAPRAMVQVLKNDVLELRRG